MTSHLDPAFVKRFKSLPSHVQKLARSNYQLWLSNPQHPGIDYKRVHRRLQIFSVRIGIHHRALGIKPDDQSIIWFFIGSHAEYDTLLARL